VARKKCLSAYKGFNICETPQDRIKVATKERTNRNYTVSPKTCNYILYNNFNNKFPITIIFGTVNSQSMRHRKMVSFLTSPI